MIGTVWIFTKWYSYCNIILDKLYEHKDNIISSMQTYKNVSYFQEDGSLTKEGTQYLYERISGKLGVDIPLKVKNHKSLFYMWWVGWPISLFWTFCDDPLRRFWNFIYNLIGGSLQRISDKVFNRFP
jgi:hypothetical protein